MVGESVLIAGGAARGHARERKKDSGVLTCITVICSAPAPNDHKNHQHYQFKACMLTMRMEHGVGLCPPERGQEVGGTWEGKKDSSRSR